MEKKNFYVLPPLPYDYDALEPYISKEQLTIHHDKHHAAYVKGANAILEKFDEARKEGTEFDVKAALKELSFNIGGHILHGMFWKNMTAAGKGGGGIPTGTLATSLDDEFGSFDRFRKEFTRAASSVEGSGWAAVTVCPQTKRPLITQIEKHNMNLYPSFLIIMVLDVFEHAYYIDYKNDRAKFIEAFWNIVDWKRINERFKNAMKTLE